MIKLNGKEISVTKFPDNTSQVWKLDLFDDITSLNIRFDFENESEIFHLHQLVKLLKNTFTVPINLHMPFLPYSRQDKEVSNLTTFALRSFADIINSMNFNLVTTIDVHSDVAAKLFNNFVNIDPLFNIGNCIDILKLGINSSIAFPDKGAADRYTEKLGSLGINAIIGHKVRDQLTGYITRYNIEGNPKGKDILIIDDICDGGMTFKLMSEELIKQGANSVHLYVSHGIFSKGIETLRDSGVQRIFTINGEVL